MNLPHLPYRHRHPPRPRRQLAAILSHRFDADTVAALRAAEAAGGPCCCGACPAPARARPRGRRRRRPIGGCSCRWSSTAAARPRICSGATTPWAACPTPSRRGRASARHGAGRAPFPTFPPARSGGPTTGKRAENQWAQRKQGERPGATRRLDRRDRHRAADRRDRQGRPGPAQRLPGTARQPRFQRALSRRAGGAQRPRRRW